MRKLDLWLLNKLDALTTKLQRKGYRLTELYVNIAGAVLVTSVSSCLMAKSSVSALIFVGTVWSTWLWGSIRWANTNRDYPESVKIMERLNAEALKRREFEASLRYIWIGFFIGSNGADIYLLLMFGELAQRAVSIISAISIFTMLYMHGCFYIGPGHFARERKDQLQGNEILDR